MARKKPLNVYPVKTLEDVNDVLGKIAELQRSIDTEELAMNEQIDKIKAETEITTSKLYKELDAFENGLQAFAEFNKEELFKKKRSIDLNFGIVGFRKAKKLATMPKTTWKRVLELLEEKGFTSGIRTKKSANKDVLNEWSDEKLAKVCVQIKKTDSFWYEVKEEEIKSGA